MVIRLVSTVPAFCQLEQLARMRTEELVTPPQIGTVSQEELFTLAQIG